MKLPRGIGYKLSILFLVIGIVPMAAVAVITYFLAKETMTDTAIEHFVERVARDTALIVGMEIQNLDRGTRLLARSSNLRANLFTLDTRQESDPEYANALEAIRADLNSSVDVLGSVDLIAIVDPSGDIVVSSNRARREIASGRFANRPDEAPLLWTDEESNSLRGETLAERLWWESAREAATVVPIAWGDEPLVNTTYGYPLYDDAATDRPDAERKKNPEAFTFGFALGIPFPEGTETVDGTQGVLVVFCNWSAIQSILDRVNAEFARQHVEYKSGYTFLFAQDKNTVIAHKFRELYRSRLVQDHDLPGLQLAMETSPNGIGHHYYSYRGDKVAGFAPVDGPRWFLGFGINESDFYVPVRQLRNLMLVFGMIFTGLIVILIAYSSRRVTEPIRNLIRETNEIARGNLDARVDVATRDEIGLLGDSFNKMAEDLKASNKRLVEAEKQAAWREMARQVAHEIKNPLTPIKLSAQLVERAWMDEHPEFASIMKESVRNIVAQTESLRKIASDFSSYAAFPKSNPKEHQLMPLLDECIKAYSNRESSGVEILQENFTDEEVVVRVDSEELKRIFFNLFNNAFEAMPDGGKLTVSTYRLQNEKLGRVVEIRVRDTGRGISQEIAERLFEPYFTTRSAGTGLGLAICKKTIEGYGGRIAIQSEEGQGTTVIVTLPVV